MFFFSFLFVLRLFFLRFCQFFSKWNESIWLKFCLEFWVNFSWFFKSFFCFARWNTPFFNKTKFVEKKMKMFKCWKWIYTLAGSLFDNWLVSELIWQNKLKWKRKKRKNLSNCLSFFFLYFSRLSRVILYSLCLSFCFVFL